MLPLSQACSWASEPQIAWMQSDLQGRECELAGSGSGVFLPKGDRFPLELTSTSRLLHLASLTLRTLYSYPVLRRQARCIHSLIIIWLWMCVSSSSRPVCDSCFLTMKGKDCSNFSSFLPYTSPGRHGYSGLTLYWQSHLFLPETRQEGYLYTLPPLTNSKMKNIITTFSRELLTAVL